MTDDYDLSDPDQALEYLARGHDIDQLEFLRRLAEVCFHNNLEPGSAETRSFGIIIDGAGIKLVKAEMDKLVRH